MQTTATTREIMATVLARDLVDGEWVEVGANLPVPRAGVLLAHLMWGPNMTVMIAMTKANVLNEPVIEEFELITDHRATRWAEAYYIHNDLVENMKFRRKGVFFAGALQIDRYGNSNLIAVGADYRKPKFRGPGAIGVCNATVMNSRFHLVVNSHDARIFVPRCDFVSALGWGQGGADALEWESERSRDGALPKSWLRSQANSIEGGTSEVQLNIVAKRILNLPDA